MILDKHFKRFHANIGLKKGRRDRIRSALSNLAAFSESDDPISAIKVGLFSQGSFAIGTAVIPIKEGEEFDADAVVVLDLSSWPVERQQPPDVIRWFANRLRNNPSVGDKVREKNRCVRIDYAGDFHLDVVPACGNTSGPILVPTKEDVGWRPSDPRGYAAWIKDMDGRAGGKLCRATKMLKHWRNLKMGRDAAPKSIILTTLLGYRVYDGHALGYASDAQALVELMEALDRHLSAYAATPVVLNPSLLSEDLAESWADDPFRIFKEKFGRATQSAREAFDEDDKHTSIVMWQDLFGDAWFPTDLDGAAGMAEAASVGKVYVKPTGEVTTEIPDADIGVALPRHKSYGE